MDSITDNPILLIALGGILGTIFTFVWTAALWKRGVDKDLGNFSQFIIEFRTEMKELRNEFRTEMKGLRNEFCTEMKELRNEFRTEMKELHTDIKQILHALHPKTQLIEQNSPLRLTDYGKKMAHEIHADDILEPYIAQIGEETKDKTVYGIQERCRQFSQEELMNQLRVSNLKHANSLEVYAFDQGIRLSEVLDVLGITLRDKVFDYLKLSKKDSCQV